MASRGSADNHLRRALQAMLLCCATLLPLDVCMRAPASHPSVSSSDRSASLQPVIVRPVPPAIAAASDDSVTRAAFRNVDFHMTSDVILDIHFLDGAMQSVSAGQPVVFDDKTSFVIDIDSARVGLTPSNLANLMNHHVFAYPGAPLRNMRFALKGDRLIQSGVLHKVVDIPFEITAALSVTDEGKVRIRPTAMQIFGVDGLGLMRALGIKLDRLLDLRKAKGVSVQGNDLLLQADSLLPPPAISGRVVAVRLENGEVVQIFGSGAGAVGPSTSSPAISPLDSAAKNYMRFRGGTLRFGKLFMVQADMQIIDQDPRDPFDFSIDDYNRQLVAGYSRNTLDGGLKVYMPDLRDAEKSLSN